MIVMIIFLVLLLIPIVLTILTKFEVIEWDEEVAYPILVTFISILALADIIGGGVAIAHNTPSYIKGKEYKYQEQIKLYQNDKLLLESYHLVTEDNGKTTFTSDVTFETLSTVEYYKKVEKYNKDIYDFKVDIKQQQYDYSNPWISWFISPACFSVTDETLDSLTYTIGK